MILNRIFGDGMFLQINKPIRVFGEGGGAVSVEFCDQSQQKEFVAAKWALELKPVDYGRCM